MSFRPIGEAFQFPAPPRCRHWKRGAGGQRCEERATVWLVSGQGLAISHECQAHADAAIAEYNAHPEIAMLQGWTTHPITILERDEP